MTCDLVRFRRHLRAVRWVEAQCLNDWVHALALEYLRDSYDALGAPADARAAIVRACACALLAVKVDGVWPFPDFVFGVRHAHPEQWRGAAATALDPPLKDDEVAAAERALFKAMKHFLLRDTVEPESPYFPWYCMMLRTPREAGSTSDVRRAASDVRRRRLPAAIAPDWVARVFGASDDVVVPAMHFMKGCLPWLAPGAAVEYLGADEYLRASVEAVHFDGCAFCAAVWLGGRLRWTTTERLRPAAFFSNARALRPLD